MGQIRVRSLIILGGLLVIAKPCSSSAHVEGRRELTWVEQTLKTMNIEEKIGQMFLIRAFSDYSTLTSPDLLIVEAQIKRFHVGSVDLGARMAGPNLVKGTPEQSLAIMNDLQRTSKIPLLIGADIERGLASRLSLVPDFPFPMAFGATNDPSLVGRFAAETAEEARAVGIEWAFAPDADTNSNPQNPIIGNRSFGDNPAAVGRLVAAYIRGAHQGRMMVTLKHFPGEGDTATDPHARTTIIQADRQHLDSVELVPFRKALEVAPDAVMLAQASVPAIDPDPKALAPTSSKLVDGLLRHELGFQGIVITDALEMQGLTDLYAQEENPSGRIAVDAVKAGDDVLMLPRDLPGAYKGLLDAVHSGEISEARLDASVRRILLAKASLGLNENRFGDPAHTKAVFAERKPFELAQQISDASVTLVRSNGKVLPLASDTKKPSTSGSSTPRIVVVTFTDSSRSRLGKQFESEITARSRGAHFFHFYNDQIGGENSSEAAAAAMKQADVVVVGAFITRLAPAQIGNGGTLVNAVSFAGRGSQLLSDLLAAAPERTVTIALGSPYLIENFPTISNYICTYSLASTAEVSAAKAIFGEIQNKATLPITLPGVAARGTSIPWPTVQSKSTNH